MRVRFTLHEKGLAFTTNEEDLKNFSPELKALHPEAKVPVLVHGETVIYESAVITEYLEDAFPAIPLMPKEANLRAELRLMTYWCNHHFKPDVDRLKYGASRFTDSECAGVEARMTESLAKLEQRLERSDWLVGNTFTLADIHVFPFCRQLLLAKLTTPLSPSLRLSAWVERTSARPAFQKTMEPG